MNEKVNYELLLAKYMALAIAPMNTMKIEESDRLLLSIVFEKMIKVRCADGSYDWSKFCE